MTEKNESDDFFGFAETDSMKDRARRCVLETIEDLPDESKEAYLEALEKAPELVEMESPIIRFLRVENYNPWAAAQRLLRYWAFRKSIFGERAFLPLDLTGNGAMTFADMAHLNGGRQTILPNDDHGRVVFCLDHSKNVAVTAEHYPRTRFFLLHAMSETPTCQREGAVIFIILNNPMGALFDAAKMVKAAKLFSQVLPMKLYKVHILCCPPAAGGEKYAETFVPIVLKNIGTFFSDKATVHVADTEAGLLAKLQPLGFRKENVPKFVGGTWEYDQFVQWQQQRGLLVQGEAMVVSPAAAADAKGNAHLAAIVKETLANYSAKLLQETSSLGDEPEQVDKEPYSNLPWNANSELVELHPVELTAIEKNAVLRDIYGSTNVPFTVTKQVQEEGRARAQLQVVIDRLDDALKVSYLEAMKRAPDLVELESDPLRFLSCNNMDPELSARHLVMYWKKRQEIFGERAFFPLTLKGNSALSPNAIELVETGAISILPHDTKGRIVLLLNRSKLAVKQRLYSLKDRLQSAFYIFSVMSEREESRRCGVVGITVLSSGKNTSKFAFGLVDLVSSGAIPIRSKAHHMVCHGQKATYMQWLVLLVLGPLARWSFMKTRSVVHTFDKDQDMVEDLMKYGFQRESIPGFLGGGWHDRNFSEFIQERVALEKTMYGTRDDDSSKLAAGSSRKRRAKREKGGVGEAEAKAKLAKAKRRRMEAVYGRRKREKLRIEFEVRQEQCKQFALKNEALEADNRRLEGLIVVANVVVADYELKRAVQSPPVTAGTGSTGSISNTNLPLQPTGAPPQQSFAEGSALTNQAFCNSRLTASALPFGSAPPMQEQLLYQQLATSRGASAKQSLSTDSTSDLLAVLNAAPNTNTAPNPTFNQDPRFRGL